MGVGYQSSRWESSGLAPAVAGAVLLWVGYLIQSAGAKVAMVGAGVNDAPAWAKPIASDSVIRRASA